jgi:hypothetical protein
MPPLYHAPGLVFIARRNATSKLLDGGFFVPHGTG